ncbi:MAG: hypothetical protein ACE5I1_27465, partial [bacterium]
MNSHRKQSEIYDLHKNDRSVPEEDMPSRVEEVRNRQSRLLHQSTVAALLVVIVLAFFARHTEVTNRFELDPADSNLILLALKTVSPKKPEPPPPPKPKIAPPPVVKKAPDKVPDMITTKIKPVPKRPNRGRKTNAKLQIAHDTDVFSANASSLGSLNGPDARDRRLPAVTGSPNLTAELRSDRDLLTAGPGDFSLNNNKAELRRNTINKPTKVNLNIDKKLTQKDATGENQNETISDFLNADVSLVLTSSDLSMGIDEYKIWNKINAEFDRWDKGRYGALPYALKRKGRAMIASFQYKDGSAHRIVWLRGNTRLYVHGESLRKRLEELQQA